MASGRCTECGKSMARVARERERAGLPRFAPSVKTCSPRCSFARRRRWMREWWARIRHRKLEVRRPGEPWRCSECGIGVAAAERKRRRLGMRSLHGNAVVCTPRCGEARELRRYVVRYGRVPRRRA